MAENEKEEKQKEVKIGFFRKIGYSICKFEKYPEMAAEGVSRALTYLAGMMIIFSIIVALALVYKTYTYVNKGIEYIQNELPDITYIDGKLNVDSIEPIIINNEKSIIGKIIIDTKIEDKGKIDNYINSISEDNPDIGIIVLNDKIIIKEDIENDERVYTYDQIFSSISDTNFNNFTKQDFINYFTGKSMISVYLTFFCVMAVCVFAIYLLSILIDILLITVLGKLTLLFVKLNLKFSAVFSMSVYALTISLLLKAIYVDINTITGFEMKYFNVMYTSIAYVCLIAAIFIMKLDFIKRQAELMKIMEEQKKVKQEIEEENTEKDKKEDEEQEDKEENNKDEKEPDGSEA